MPMLKYQIKGLCQRNREGSYSTQQARLKSLLQSAEQLKTLGYRNMQLQSLKPKHIDALVKQWQAENCSISTIKNRMSCLRWWAEKINKAGIINADNSHYGIASRSAVAKVSKAIDLQQNIIDKITDVYVKMSLRLQAEFGLRREEAMKFIPSFADQGNHIRLKGSWTKGGRERIIPIRTESQRTILNESHQLVGNGSLIPVTRSYKQHLKIFERQTSGAGLNKTHGLRHAYAQQRYRELTGWEPPVCGGVSRKHMNQQQHELDRKAREIISADLGHGREQVTTVYLG